jgi:hypothetical protein
MHVPLRRRQILMSGELLYRSRRCASHGQMRTERVPQPMHAALRDFSSTRHPLDVMLHDVGRQR